MYRDVIQKQRQAEFQAARKEQKALEAERRRAWEAEEAKRHPWEKEMALCDALLSHMETLLPKREEIAQPTRVCGLLACLACSSMCGHLTLPCFALLCLVCCRLL